MGAKKTEPHWKINWLKPRLLWNEQIIRPAEIGDGLVRVMMDKENALEDANYHKVVPNHFLVELGSANYDHQFKPLEKSLVQQWRDRLSEHMMTANSRLGRKIYRLAGHLQIELRPAPDLKDNQARILCRVEPDAGTPLGDVLLKSMAPEKELAFLEAVDGGRRWSLHPGENTIGRDEACDIFLDMPLVQEKRLVSAQHAMIRIAGGEFLLLDGSPSGRPSANGTYVNAQRISEDGVYLKDGDTIILAAINPRNPRLDTPGVAAFRFHKPDLNTR